MQEHSRTPVAGRKRTMQRLFFIGHLADFAASKLLPKWSCNLYSPLAEYRFPYNGVNIISWFRKHYGLFEMKDGIGDHFTHPVFHAVLGPNITPQSCPFAVCYHALWDTHCNTTLVWSCVSHLYQYSTVDIHEIQLRWQLDAAVWSTKAILQHRFALFRYLYGFIANLCDLRGYGSGLNDHGSYFEMEGRIKFE